MDDLKGRVRVRYAPSPTGYQHVGGMRTALYCWLFARANDGTFILRIEDTDRTRFVEDSVKDIMDTLRWLGLDWDEGPYFQSERLDIYREHAEKLVKMGRAYYCYCSPERLERVRKERMAAKLPPGYDRHCRNLTESERLSYEKKGIAPVIRFKTPLEGVTTFVDKIRGEVSFENSILDDTILLKSDGYPTYHLASVVDDHLMGITHVMRGEDWISSAPRHILLYEAFEWDLPVFVHLPNIMGQDGRKLSKRHGATNAREFIQKGYLPEAMVNFLVLLGWSYDDSTEIFSMEDLKRVFSIDRVRKSNPIFSYEKLDWFNGLYIRRLSVEDLARRCLPYMQRAGLLPDPCPQEKYQYYLRVIPLIQERLKLLSDIPYLTKFFFEEEPEFDNPQEMIPNNMDRDGALRVLSSARDRIEKMEKLSEESLERTLRELVGELGLKTSRVFMPLRVAVTGRTVSPGLFETMSVLGKERVLKRIDKAIETISKL
ncbi:MAG: glutamate--tRNA ligase [bacterium]